MALLNRWPWFLDDRSDELLRAFAPLWRATPERRGAGVFPPVNLFDDGSTFLMRAELPGVDKDSIEVTAQGDQLSIRGERAKQQVAAGASYHRRERESGHFRRTLTLPQPVDAGAIHAVYREGVLELTLPRVPEAKPRKISVN